MLAAGRTGCHYIIFYAVLLVLGIVGLAWCLPAGLAARLLPTERTAGFGQRFITVFFRFYLALMASTGLFRCELRALDSLRKDGSLVIAANHPSLLDAPLVLSRLPRIVCVMKAELLQSPFVGGGAKLAGYIENDAPLALVKRAAHAISNGSQLLIFPEGTRTVHKPVNPFRGGFALIAKAAGVPIQTVFLETNSPFLGKGWPILRMPPFPIVFRARLGRRFTVDGTAQATVSEIERYFRSELAPTSTSSAQPT